MIRTRECIAMFSLMVILACLSVAAEKPNDVNAPVTFEVSPIELPEPSAVSLARAGKAKPSSPWKGTTVYAAGVPCKEMWPIPRPGSPTMEAFKPFVLSQNISEEQRRFLDATDINVSTRTDETLYSPPEDPNSRQALLYAVSVEDAKKMAEAYLRYVRDTFSHRIADQEAIIKELSEKRTAWQQKLPQLARTEETTRKELEEMKTQVPYRSEQQALDAAAELDRMLNGAQVDIAGIQATLKAIQDRMKPPAWLDLAEDMKEKLEVMFVEQSILLKAAEARKRMATELRKQADHYIDLMQALPRIASEQEQLTRDLPNLSERLEQVKQELPFLMLYQPTTLDNKAFIYPIRR